MVSHPENGSDSPIGSDRDRGRDSLTVKKKMTIKNRGQCFLSANI